MSESGAKYNATQLSAMQSDIAKAKADYAAGNYDLAKSDLESYYSEQTIQQTGYAYRGYATEALQVLQNTGYGIVANQEVANAVGESNYTPQYRTFLELSLASVDNDQIIGNQNQVPTLTEDAQEHVTVFSGLGVPIESWGGTTQSAFGYDFTEGVATAAEEKNMSAPPVLASLTIPELHTSFYNLLVAGVDASLPGWLDPLPFLNVGILNDVYGVGTLIKLNQAIDNLGSISTPSSEQLNFNAEPDGSYQIAANGASDVSLFSYASATATQPEGAVSTSGSNVSAAGVVPDLTESNSTVSLGESTQLNLSGNNNVVSAQGNDVVRLNGAGDSLSGINGGTLSGGQVSVSGNNDIVYVGPNETINLGKFSGDTIYGSNDTIIGASGVSATINGNGNTISGGNDSSLTINGNDNTGDFGAADTISWGGSGDVFNAGTDSTFNGGGGDDTVNLGSGSYVGLLGGSGYQVSMSGGTVGAWSNTGFNLTGNGDTSNLAASESVGWSGSGDVFNAGTNSIFNGGGGSDTVNLGSGSYVGLLGGSGYQVSMSGGTVGAWSNTGFNLTGNGDTSNLAASESVGWSGSGDVFNAGTDSIFNGGGGNDTVNLGGGSYVGLLGGSGYQVSMSGGTVGAWSNTGFNLTGNGDTSNLAASESVGWSGSGDVFNAGTDSIFNGGGGNDTVNLGGGSYLGLLGGAGYTVNLGYSTLNTWSNTSLNLAGGGDTVGLGASSYVGLLSGSGYTVNSSNSTIATLGNVSFNAGGGGDYVNLGGTGDYVGLLGGSGYTVTGNSDTAATWGGTSFNFSGSNSQINLGGTSDYVGLVGGGSDLVTGNEDTVETVPGISFNLSGSYDNAVAGGNGSVMGILSGTGDIDHDNNGKIQTLQNVGASLYSSDDNILLDSGNVINLTGNHDTLYTQTGVHIDLSGLYDVLSGSGDVFNVYGGNTGDDVEGSGDTGSNWGLWVNNDGFGFGYYSNFDDFSAGSVPKIAVGIDQVARGESSIYTALAPRVSEMGVLAGLQSAENSASDNVGPGGQFEGANWGTRDISWSFADGSQSGYSGSLNTAEQQVVSDAMRAWEQASGYNLVEEPDNRPTDITIGFSKLDTPDSGMLGSTDYSSAGGYIVPGVDIHLEDPTQLSFIGGTGSQLTYSDTGATLYQVALHEIGHALGLADSASPTSVMYYASTALNRDLNQSDILNASSLYRNSSLETASTGTWSRGNFIETASPGGDSHDLLASSHGVQNMAFDQRGL